MPDDDTLPGLAWPAPDTGPTPPPEYRDPAADGEAKVYRKPLPLWDRVKFLLLLGALWGLLLWQLKSDNPIITWEDAVRETWRSKWWIVALAGVEIARQVHYLISEHWSRYHRFWAFSVFGRLERRVGRLDDWNRYRVARVLKLAVFVVLVSILLAGIYHESPPSALFGLPARLWDAAPFVLQLAFGFLFVAVQFLGIFWLLSRGGTEVYFPDDIKTRFSDVWGQDAVLERVKENMLFLENPESVEDKGGYVPGGLLLWGPPGTGKTLMAEAVAGETGKPYVFVDPGAFAQPLSGFVLTPAGWRKMGDIAVGDEVVGRDGRSHRVLGVYPQGEREIYRVSFSDGGTARVTADHLWAVQTPWLRERGGDRWHVRRTADLGPLRRSAKRGWYFSIPVVSPVQFAHRDVPLDPYVLGALLGDGCFTGRSVQLINTDHRIVARVKASLPDGVTITGTAPRLRLVGKDESGRSRLATILEELGVWGLRAESKFVPDIYLYNSTAVRLELLRGLMDTDGSVHPSASGRSFTTFGTSSPRVRDDVVELVRSLGGLVKVTPATGGTWRRLPFWHLHIRLPNEINPFFAKGDRVVPRGRTIHRFITAIAPDGREDAQCILVDAPDHLYVCDDYAVTHNTNMFFGVGILKVKSLFRKLRKLALRYGGVIVFFDEADSLGSRGMLTPGPFGGGAAGASAFSASAPTCNGLSYLDPRSAAQVLRAEQEQFVAGMGMGGGGMGTLQALLTELSGLKKPRGFLNRIVRRSLGMRPKPPPKYRILVMMATNMPQALDEALLRPGRIDRIYKVGYPSKAGRVRTYEGYLAKVRHDLAAEDVDRLATITPYATGATIKDLVNEALICAIRDGRDCIEWRDVVRAKQLKDLGPPEDVEYIERERHAVAIHEACHAVIAYRVRQHLTIDIATIEKGGTYLGMVASIPPEDQFTRWRTEYEADIMVSLASLAGERRFFDGDNSSGVSGDLESATQLATLMEGYWGMGSTVASHGVTQKVGIAGGGKPGEGGDGKRGTAKERTLLEGSLGTRIEKKLGDLLVRTEALLDENEAMVLAVAHALETHKTVTGDDIEAIIEGRPGLLIDGRPYHHRTFVKRARDYHRQVVDAHKGHGKVEVPLPALPAIGPIDGVDVASNP